jgi:peptidoglycan pentaglycine glycine transferase (the first glycine)
MSTDNLVSTVYTQENRDQWSAFVARAPSGHLMQSYEWGDFKAALGWRVQRIGVECDGRIVAGAQVLLRPLPWLPLSIAYVPKGPMVDPEDDRAVAELSSAVHQAARKQRAIFLRIEPNLPDDGRVHDVLQRCGFRPSVHTNQPRSTIVIDLAGGEDVVLANMPRKKTRKLIRRAIREGVKIVEGGSEDICDFYRILRSTAEMKGFPAHDKVFYEQAWRTFQGTGAIKLLLAKYQEKTVAGKMIFVFGDRSMHFWGGTSHEGRDVYASYLIQWEAIKWAIARGCKYCDLWGIPDEIAEMLKKGQDVPKDRLGGLWGVYSFKRGFGGEVECYAGAYDYVYRPLLYRLGIIVLARNVSIDAMSGWLEKFSRP